MIIYDVVNIFSMKIINLQENWGWAWIGTRAWIGPPPLQVISRRVVLWGRGNQYIQLVCQGFCTVNCRPTVLFGVLRRFQHCTGHITTGSWKGRGNQYIYSSLGFCTVNCRPTASNYQLSHLRPWRGSNPGCRGGRRECYHSATVAPPTIGNQLPTFPHRVRGFNRQP